MRALCALLTYPIYLGLIEIIHRDHRQDREVTAPEFRHSQPLSDNVCSCIIVLGYRIYSAKVV